MSQQPTPSPKPQPNSQFRFMKYAGMAFQMAVTIFLFVFAGRKLDNIFESPQPYFTAGMALLGVFLALYLVIRQLMSEQK